VLADLKSRRLVYASACSGCYSWPLALVESRDHSRRRLVRLLLSRIVQDAMQVARCGRASTDTDTVVILPYGTICRYYRVRRVARPTKPRPGGFLKSRRLVYASACSGCHSWPPLALVESRDHSRRRLVRLLLSRVVKDAMQAARCGRAITDTTVSVLGDGYGYGSHPTGTIRQTRTIL
jgi:hypothetical protein